MKTSNRYLLLVSCMAALANASGAWAQDDAFVPPSLIAKAAHAPPSARPSAEVNLPPPNNVSVLERAQGSPTKPRVDPFPVEAAGWAKPRSDYFFDSRWEEDWVPLQQAGEAPPLKAIPLFNDLVTLTLSAEDRIRTHTYGNG